MIQIFKYFWLSLLITILSLPLESTGSSVDFSEDDNPRKTSKISKKKSHRKKKKKRKKKSSALIKKNLKAKSLEESIEQSPQEIVSSPSHSNDPSSQSVLNNPSIEGDVEESGENALFSPAEGANIDDSSSPSLTKTEEQISKEEEVLNEDVVPPVAPATPEEAIKNNTETLILQQDKKGKSRFQKDQEIMTLKEALEGAYTQSPLLTAEYQVKVAQMALSGAKREWLPKTGASVGYSRTTGDYVSSRGLSIVGARSDTQHNINNESTQGGLSLQQNLYKGGSTTANILAQEKTLDATVASYIIALRDTLFSAIQSFLQLSSKQEIFRLSKSNQALLERQLDVTQNRYEFGELTRYDVAATQAKLDKAKADVISSLAEVEIAKANLIKVTGITGEKALEKPKEPSHLLPTSKAEAIQIALQLSPEIRKQEALAETAKAETDRVFADLLPSFDISANATRRLTDSFESTSYLGHGKTRREELEASATLSIPLDFRGTTQTNIRQQKYVAAQKRLAAIYERRNVIELVSKYWDSLEAARARIAQIKSQVKAGEIAVETVTEGFLAGNNTTLDVLSAEQELFSAQVDLVNAGKTVILSAYQLLGTIGRLDIESLALDVNAYDPKEDYNRIPFWGINIDSDERITTQDTSTTLIENAAENI